MGSVITFRYQELSEGGVPRFPSFVGVCPDRQPADATPKREATVPRRRPPASLRHFEYADGKSDKFWEISTGGGGSRCAYGRSGTAGQTSTKSFPDEAAAAQHAEKLIREKTGKGYRRFASPAEVFSYPPGHPPDPHEDSAGAFLLVFPSLRQTVWPLKFQPAAGRTPLRDPSPASSFGTPTACGGIQP